MVFTALRMHFVLFFTMLLSIRALHPARAKICYLSRKMTRPSRQMTHRLSLSFSSTPAGASSQGAHRTGSTPFYTANPPLERASLDDEAMTALVDKKSANTLFVPVTEGTKVLVKELDVGSKFEAVFLAPSELDAQPEKDTCIYLGKRGGKDFIAVDLAKVSDILSK